MGDNEGWGRWRGRVLSQSLPPDPLGLPLRRAHLDTLHFAEEVA